MKRRKETLTDILVDAASGLAPFGMLTLFAGYWSKNATYFVIGFLLVATGFGLPIIVREIEESRLSRAGLPAIDRMTGHDFERWLTLFFRSKGYHATRTPDQGDWGADVIVKAPDGRRIAVQAKRWRGRVGVEAVQQVVAARAHYGCDHAMVVTNSYFTAAAELLAKSNDVELWDRDRLTKEILAASTSAAPGARRTVGGS